jgi:hypothetical protein
MAASIDLVERRLNRIERTNRVPTGLTGACC